MYISIISPFALNALLTALNEYSLMLGTFPVRHLEHNILETGCLCRRPVNTGSLRSSRNRSHIDDEIPDLSPKYIRGSKAKDVASLILITIYDAKACKGREWLQNWHIIWVSNQHGIIVVNDG